MLVRGLTIYKCMYRVKPFWNNVYVGCTFVLHRFYFSAIK